MSKGGKASNNAQVQMQMQEAAEARQKEAERKARLEKGTKAINELFEGKAVMGTRKQKLDFSKFNPDAKAPVQPYGTVSTVAPVVDYGLQGGVTFGTRDMSAAEKKAFLKKNPKMTEGNYDIPAAVNANSAGMTGGGPGGVGSSLAPNQNAAGEYVEGGGPV